MKYLLFVLFFPCAIVAQDISFHKAYGNNEYDYGESIVQLEDSSYVIAGATSSFGSGNTDVLLIGIDKQGNFQWQRTFGNQQIEWAEDIILHSNESLYTLAYTNDTDGNGYDILLIKTNQNGTVDWQERYGGDDWDFAYELIESQDGEIVICGETYSNTNGENDALFMKINAENGSLIWEQRYGGEGHDTFFDLTEDLDGNLWFTGYSVVNDSDLVVLKTDPQGSELLNISEQIGEHVIGRVIKTHITGEILLGYDYWKSNSIDSVETGRWKFDTDANIVWQRFDPESDRSRYVIGITPLEDDRFVFTTRYVQDNSASVWWMYSNQGWFISTGSSTEFGNFLDDDFTSTLATSDGGIVHVGTTDSWGFGNKSVWVVKMNEDFTAPANAEEEYVTSLLEITNSFKIYPNPSSDLLYFDLDTQELIDYQIFDANGRLILKGSLDQQIDIQSLIAGKYIIRLFGKNNHLGEHRFIKVE
ncbi:MAG: T9SS type A sorting domain-containing protein [Bacteroidota bacterium]